MTQPDAQPQPSSWRRALVVVITPFLLVVAGDRLVQLAGPARRNLSARLKVPVAQNQIYLLGNSMFKTGVDVSLLRERLPPALRVDLAYHDGEYTNLWYLVIKNAIMPAPTRPRLLVWGFRPTYAIRPAFRKKQVCDVDRFYVAPDPRFDAIQGGLALDGSDRFHVWLAEKSWLYRYRDLLHRRLLRVVRSAGLSATALIVPRQAADLAQLDRPGADALGDVLVRLASGGKVRRAEEQVADAGRRRFIYGQEKPFARSFVPEIVRLLKSHRIPQLVILWKPVQATSGEIAPTAMAYYWEARDWLRSEGVPMLDLMKESAIDHRHYAKGDHHNAVGRRVVSELLAKRIAELLQGR